MQAYLDKVLDSYLIEMDFSVVPTLKDMAKEFDVSEQTIRRRLADLECGSYRGFIRILRDSMIAVIRDRHDIKSLNIRNVLGFDSIESMYRYVRDNHGTTPKEIFGQHANDLKHVYIFEFPNGAIKFGVSSNPFIRVGSHIANYISGNKSPVNAYCTGLMEAYSEVENKLISALSEFSIGSNREWVIGIPFDDIKELLLSIVDGEEITKLNNKKEMKHTYRASPSEQAKQAGLSSLAELIRLTGLPERTIHDWHKMNQAKFQLAVDAALYRKGKI